MVWGWLEEGLVGVGYGFGGGCRRVWRMLDVGLEAVGDGIGVAKRIAENVTTTWQFFVADSATLLATQS